MNEGRRIVVQVDAEKIKSIINCADEYFNIHIEDLKKIRTFNDLNDISAILDKLSSLYNDRIEKMVHCKDPEKDLSVDDIGMYFFILFVRSEAISAGLEYCNALEEMTVIKKEQIN